ncbi:hypothetical protein D3C84_643230 [compost metagenome]
MRSLFSSSQSANSSLISPLVVVVRPRNTLLLSHVICTDSSARSASTSSAFAWALRESTSRFTAATESAREPSAAGSEAHSGTLTADGNCARIRTTPACSSSSFCQPASCCGSRSRYNIRSLSNCSIINRSTALPPLTRASSGAPFALGAIGHAETVSCTCLSGSSGTPAPAPSRRIVDLGSVGASTRIASRRLRNSVTTVPRVPSSFLLASSS